MKKILPILLLLVLIFGCAKVADEKLTDTVDEKEEPTIKVEETVEEPAKTPEEIDAAKPAAPEVDETDEAEEAGETVTIKKPKLELTGELKELLDKIDSKVKTYKYSYGPPPLTTEINTYSVQLKNSKGEEEYLMKIRLYEYDYAPTKLEDYWDTVFLNPATKEANIYCLDKSQCQSKEVDKTGATEAVDYADYAVKAPHEWAQEITADAKLIGPELLDKKTVTKFEYTGPGGEKFNVWLDNTYGLPQQVVMEQLDGSQLKYLFKDMKINSESDEDFKPPF